MADNPYDEGSSANPYLAPQDVNPYLIGGATGKPDPSVGPVFAERTPTTLGTMFRHPLSSLRAIGERFPPVVADTSQHGTLAGAAANLASDALIKNTSDSYQTGAQRLGSSKDTEQSARPDPAKSGVEHVSDFMAGVLGSLPSPESWVEAPAKFAQIAGRPILSRMIRGAIGGGVVNAATDPLVQGAQVARGMQDKYSPMQTLEAGLMGTVAGGAIGGAHGAVEAHGERSQARAAAREAAMQGDNPYLAIPGGEPKGLMAKYQDVRQQWRDWRPMDGRAPVSADDVWSRLISQESGGNQAAVSPAGAFGVAQLMPDTAADVARSLGRPALADLAATNTPAGRAANELLGKTYYNQLLGEFGGDHTLASAAYNAGPRRVRSWVAAFGTPAEIGPATWAAKIPFAETRDYVQHVAGATGGAEPRGRVEAAAGVSGPGFVPPGDQGLITGSLEREALPAASAEVPRTAPSAEGGIPIPESAPARRDMTDQALDILRAGDRVKVDNGPSLVEALVKAGGVQDMGGELAAMDLAKGDRLQKMLRRVNTGMDMDSAAQWAQERGYLGGLVAQGHPRATPQDLVDAIRREVSGEKVFARQDEPGSDLRAHVSDLEEQLHHLGLDPATMSNAQIKAALSAFHAEPDVPGAAPVGHAAPDMAETMFGLGEKPTALGHRDALIPDILSSSKGGGKASLRGQQTLQGIAAPDMARLEPIQGLSGMAQQLRDSLDLTHRQGRLGMKGALGTYNRKTGVIRTLGMPDVEVLAHEAGHAMEFTHRFPAVLQMMKQFSKLLKSLDYDSKAQRRHEGFAEFLRWYMTNPEFANTVAPGFTEAFEAALTKDAPDVAVALQRIQNAYAAYQTSPSAAVVSSMVVRPPKQTPMSNLSQLARRKGPVAAISELGAEVYRGMLDKLDPLKRAVDNLTDIKKRNTGNSDPLLTDKDSYKLMRMAVGATAAGHMDIMHGSHGYHSLDPESHSLAGAIAMALGDRFSKWDETKIDQFGAYLAARRMMQEHGRHIRGELATKPALEPEVWIQAAQDFDTANPSWREAAGMVYDFTNAQWKKAFDAGKITQKMYEDGIKNHPDYVPVVRDVSDKAGGFGTNKKGGNTKFSGGVHHFEGSSERPIINPLYTLMRQAYELNSWIARNDAINALDDLAATAGPGSGAIFERIPGSEMSAIPVDAIEAIRNALGDHGIGERDAVGLESTLQEMFGDTALTQIYRRKDTNERGEPIIYGWRNGERYAARLPDGAYGRHLLDALTMSGWNGPTSGMGKMLMSIASAPARALSVGVTAHPQFFLANTIRDQFTAHLLTDVGYKPFASQAKSLAEELTQREGGLTREYNVMMGPIGGAQTAAEHIARGEGDLQALRKKGYPIRRFMSLSGIIQATELSETSTRLGIFRNALRKAKDGGLSDWEAAREASYQARDYMDFDRRGGWGAMLVAQRIVPFLNASLQAVDKSRRVGQHILKAPQVIRALFGGPPVNPGDRAQFNHAMRLWLATSAMATASLALRAMYADDPEYQEAADYLRDTHWVIPLPNGELAAVPKPFDLAALSNIAERAYEATALHDPTAMGRLGAGLWKLFVPEVAATIITIPFQLAGNKDAFGSPIVPEHLRRAEPEDQRSERNSVVGDALGKWLNLSPAQADHVMKATGGSIARDVLGGIDSLARPSAPIERDLPNTFIAGRFIKDWTRGTTSSKKFWDLISDDGGKYSAAEASVRLLANDGKIPEAVDRLKKMDPAQRAYVMSEMFNEGDAKLMHPITRASKVLGAVSGLVSDLQQGNVRGANLQPLPLTPQQRRQAIDGLNRYSAAEKRDALIEAGVEGWANKKPMDRAAYLSSVPQEVRNALTLRLGVEFKNPALAAPETWASVWAQAKPVLEAAPNEAAITQMLTMKRLKGRSGAERYLREVTPAQ